MTEDHARGLLGLKEGATEPEVATAYRRLMQTVHPDVCKGPEAARLAHDATEARNAVLKRLAENAAAAAPSWEEFINQPHGAMPDEAELQELVLRILTRTGERRPFRMIVLDTICEMKHLPEMQRLV